jgi:hypothetical protein
VKSILLLIVALTLTGSLQSIAATPARANSEIEVVEQRAESDFPNGVKFFIEARSPDEIDDIRVFFKKLGQSSRSAYRAVEFQPGTQVRGESRILSGRSGEYIPPGTRIEYSFQVSDKGGRVLRTEDQVFVYLDNRFEWETASDGLITVYYYGNEDQARMMLETAQEALERMGPILGIDPEEPLHIVTYSNYSHMSDALPFRSQATSEQLITQGTAFTEERVLLVHGGEGNFLGTTSHEFVHLLVADAAGRALTKVPTWLNEGLAEYGNIDTSDEYRPYLNQAIANGRVRPLWHQITFSGTPLEIITAYGQGESVVEFMISTYGGEKMAELISALKRSFDIDASLEEVYGFDQYGLDSRWRQHMGMEILPPPENRQAPQQATATTPPTLAPTPTRTPTSVPQSPATPTPTPTAGLDETGSQPPPQASTGCSAPNHQGGLVVDLAVLVVMGGPLTMLSARTLRRRIR